jgi:hypothetical protein
MSARRQRGGEDGVWLILPEHTELDGSQFTETTKPPSLEELQAMVGGYVELVRLPRVGLGWIHEEGKLEGLPFNSVATDLCRQLGALHPTDFIVGPFVITTGKAKPD